MAFRKKLRSKYSKKYFTKTAKKVHKKNGYAGTLRRGGIRL